LGELEQPCEAHWRGKQCGRQFVQKETSEPQQKRKKLKHTTTMNNNNNSKIILQKKERIFN
jgi:hypothetical protein